MTTPPPSPATTATTTRATATATTTATTRATTTRPAADAGRSAVRLEGLVKRFGEVTAVAGVDLAVAPGEVVALLGPSPRPSR